MNRRGFRSGVGFGAAVGTALGGGFGFAVVWLFWGVPPGGLRPFEGSGSGSPRVATAVEAPALPPQDSDALSGDPGGESAEWALQRAPGSGPAASSNGPPGSAPVTPPALLSILEARLEPEIRRAMAAGGIPSLTIALVRADTVLWAAGYGEANRRTRAPATPETVYALASTAKTLVAASILQLADAGALTLTDPVHRYLPPTLRIRGEDPDNPITFLHLLTHTSGLPAGFTPTPFFAEGVPAPLEEHLAQVLRVEGRTGAQVRYSNPAYALLGLLVEQISGGPFDAELRAGILGPLGLQSTTRFPSPEMVERMAIPYQPAPDGSGLRPVEWIRFAEWPAGASYGTVLDQAVWLGTVLNGGSWRGVRILSESSLAQSFQRPFPQFRGPLGGGWGGANGGAGTGYGLGWWVSNANGVLEIAHSGSLRGFTAFLHGRPETKVGVAILTNADRAHPHLVSISYLATELLEAWISAPASDT
jgi:CubicO group peptidase (beta-lactamase class C family)